MTLSTDPYALIVDDDIIILMHACDIIEEAGFRPLEASTGDEAVELLQEHGDSIVLLFTDVEMPGSMNGFAFARHVAKRWTEVEIVVVSGRMSPQDGDMRHRATFISKPRDAELVHRHLHEKLPGGKSLSAPKRAT